MSLTLRRFAPLVLAGLVLAVAAAGLWWLRAGATVFTLVRTSAASQAWSPDRPLWVLLLGDDRRPGAGCGCSDAIHLVGVPAGGGQAVMLNIPRDLRVPIPGKGQGRVNEALARGGPTLAADVVGRFVGVPVSYVLVTTFDGLPAMVNELGGVTVVLDRPIRDRNVGLDVAPGPVRMDGAMALAYSRSRKAFADGDFSRTRNQGTLILSMLGELRSRDTSPVATLRYLSVLMRHTRLVGATTGDLFRLGRTALAIDPAAVRSVTVPGRGAMIGGASYVVATDEAFGLLADLADDAVLQAH